MLRPAGPGNGCRRRRRVRTVALLRLEQHAQWGEAEHGAAPLGGSEQTAKQAAHVKEGRDFFNEEPKPEYYKPYVYPHPLQDGRALVSRQAPRFGLAATGR